MLSIILRKCKECGLEAITEAELELFAKKSNSRHGRRNWCKKCINKYYRVNGPGHAAQMRGCKKYNRTLKGRRRNIEYNKRNPDKLRARRLARRFVPLKLFCEICDSTQNLGRHHPDYNKPLEVVTLCVTCNGRLG